MREEFSTYHPVVNMAYYIAVLVIAMFVMHPCFMLISFVAASSYEIYISREKGIKLAIGMIPLFLLTSLINPLFSHRGMTLICYLPTGNPLTLESVLYGFSTGLMITTVIMWFASFNEIVTSDKILCLMGKAIPSVGMITSMVLRFVPKYINQAKKTIKANEALGIKENGKYAKLKNGFRTFGIMSTWSLENAVITADSMKARGYGSGKRTYYTIYKMQIRDIVALIIIGILSLVVFGSFYFGITGCEYYPWFSLKDGQKGHALTAAVYIAYVLLCFLPLIINIKEDVKWHRLKSKI